MAKFPKVIFVTQDPNADRDEESLLAWREAGSSLERGEKVAVYELKEIKTRKVEVSLV